MLKPGTLWAKVAQRTEHALRCGALRNIPTSHEVVEQDGISFIVRVVSNLAAKTRAVNAQQHDLGRPPNEASPFLPYDEDLFVAEVSESHVCLLNKFNVVDHHLLIVTRSYEDQESLLNLRDFEAMWTCMMEYESLAFYNAGKTAGASQRHKHLQLVPLPLSPTGPSIPIETALESAAFQGTVGTAPGLPFIHAITLLEELDAKAISEAAAETLRRYRLMLRALGLLERTIESRGGQSAPYNLLATPRWMLLVPRSQESFRSISVNSLGFAGALLVRNERQVRIVKDCGPMTVLRSVAIPADGSYGLAS